VENAIQVRLSFNLSIELVKANREIFFLITIAIAARQNAPFDIDAHPCCPPGAKKGHETAEKCNSALRIWHLQLPYGHPLRS